ncbi:MAG: transglutaminase family protein [Planctomycetes bacterium]|nr:transglutaminase family protein [Planctomycetota bacterium]MBI3845342.1 transglutaminase family protein [Planctomycetota bacterium]
MVCRDDAQVDVVRSALTFARHEYPKLDVDAYVAKLDALAAAVREEAAGDASDDSRISALHRTLFLKEGFHGECQNFYDPRNSFLNEVLDRKAGIPITLSCVYMEVARRVGLDVLGVGLPGHFIVRHSTNGRVLFRDPFNAGRILSREACANKVREILGSNAEFKASFLEPCPKKQILARMLGNLKGVYLRSRDFTSALWVVEAILAIDPGCVEQVRDRGMIFLHLQNQPRALGDLEWYLRFHPKAEDAADVSEIVRKLRSLNAGLN